MQKSVRLVNFDVIKVIAATGIVFHHYQQLAAVEFGGIEFYGGAFTFGYLVELFYIISGFLAEYTFKGGAKFKSWFLGKLARYYPYAGLACVASLIIATMYYFVVGTPQFGLSYDVPTILTSLTLLHSGWLIEFSPAINNPSWYLCVLTLCYLLYWLSKRVFEQNVFLKKYGHAIVSLLMIPAYFVVIGGISNIPFFHLSNIRAYAGFFVGCAICNEFRRLTKKSMILLDLGLCFSTLIGFIILGLSNWYVLTYLFFPAVVITALILPQVDIKAVSKAGAISFEVYLWHVPLFAFFSTIIDGARVAVNHSYWTMIGFYLIVWMVALFLYYTVEKFIERRIRAVIIEHMKT